MRRRSLVRGAAVRAAAGCRLVVLHWWHRALRCPLNHHRDLLVPSFGHLQFECLDCRRRVELGPIYAGVSNHRRRRAA